MNVLSIKNVSKKFRKITALQDVSFSVPKPSVFGILGPNGSGKTTLLGIITNVIKASEGTVELFEEIPTGESRRRIGTLLETPNFYHYLSAVQNLKITAAIKKKDEGDIDRVLDIVNLTNRKHSPFSSYSLGMKQRLAIAAALLGNPDVLILDEPTNGLDPVGIAEIRSLIQDLASQGKTIIMASHMLDEVEKVCTHVAILKFGKLIVSGNVDDIFINDDLVEVSSSNMEALSRELLSLPDLIKIEKKQNYLQLHFSSGKANMESINQFCFEKGIVLSMLQMKKKSLETKFMELTN